jgi:CRISPR-associated protein Cas8b1/Cst1 subtype I-B
VDVGIATLTVFANRREPAELTYDDLRRAADWLAQLYTSDGAMQRMVRGMAFFNAGYYFDNPVLRSTFVQKVLYGWQSDTPVLPDSRCAFCSRPAVYRADRESVPLLNGRDVVNFSPNGNPGLPICGFCSLALQIMPLGCVKSGKYLLAAYSEQPILMLALARESFRKIQIALSIPDLEKIPGVSYEQTRFVEQILHWIALQNRRAPVSGSLTGILFTNAGQDPSVRFFRMDTAVLSWLDSVIHHPDMSLSRAWQALIDDRWMKRSEHKSEDANQLYQDILALPDKGHQFLRRHLLKTHHWGLVETFLKGLLWMEPERIQQIRIIGERFGEYSLERSGFFYEFSREREYSKWRRIVLRAADDSVRRYGASIITFDEFIALFTAPRGEVNDWRLIRDLITLIMIEKRGKELDTPLFEEDDPNLSDDFELSDSNPIE